MGKKGRKTRWRTLTITDEHSDSEESNTTTSGHRVSKGYQPQKSYYGRFTYSSQSTPTRRYQCDGTKSTRSSSTASENKITFNEDEYTRITTPRQDVLFKKGYLNKPKTYQTQTSTGNSTTSTGNSTGNGTPDHQSTDLEYESQFVFPNGFVDQNGIYYVNSFEPYPLMVFNPPTYYQDFTNVKSKRCSTGSLTESTSPNNEEASQDLSQSETPNTTTTITDFNHVYNVIYPGFYYGGACQPQDAADHHHHHHHQEPRRVKKKRRRKPSRSKSVQEATTSEYTDDSSDEVFSEKGESPDLEKEAEKKEPEVEKEEQEEEKKEPEVEKEEQEEKKERQVEEEEQEEKEHQVEEEQQSDAQKPKYDLKPDAEEFVPRAYRHPETIPVEQVQFIKIPSNFVPLPILNHHPMDGFNAFIPPGIPVNFVPQNFFVPGAAAGNYVHHHPHAKVEEEVKESQSATETPPKNHIDIAKIVSKLEEAAKEQEVVKEETTTTKKSPVKKNARKEEEKPPSPKKEPPPKPPRNYSETLKRSPPSLHCERQERATDRVKVSKGAKETAVRNHVMVQSPPAPKMPNQWISVSSRKKRKNKNVEEMEEFEDAPKEEVEQVVEPPPILEEVVEVAPPPPPPPPLPPTEEVKKEKAKTAPKKRSKTKNQKPTTKRVMIKDADLMTNPEPEKTVTEEEVVVDKIEPVLEVKETQPEPKPEEIVEEKQEEAAIEEKKDTTPEKKSKKKKKKVVKVPVPSSRSSSSTTLNILDDSYDFLLESSLLDDSSRDKTNVEVSQELDKMIQRGMYSSLEEKIRSLNIAEPNGDDFFRTIIHNISSNGREASVDPKPPPDLTKLLMTGTQPLPKTASISSDLKKLGDFLGEPTSKSLQVGGEEEVSAPSEMEEEQYPITKAVKEWMTKTRETTPDVEIFKSPSTIFRELEESVEEEEEDLLEYWEDPVVEEKAPPSSVEEGEEALEGYGGKEEYMKLRREAEEGRGSYPKHGNLPYRAICCSIM